MDTLPSFSVVIPLYNKVEYVADAIHSAANQSPPPREIIVVDDGSTDGSPEVVERMQLPTVRLIRQPNAGVAAARNVGIDTAKSEWISFLDADDQYLPGFLMALWKLQIAFPKAMVVATGYRRRYGTTTVTNSISARIQAQPALVSDLYSAWSHSPFFCTISVAVAKRAFVESGMRFPVGEPLGEDQDLWFHLGERYPIAFDQTPYADYRMGVQGSATRLAVTNPLPCYARLAERVSTGLTPPHMRSSAVRLVASHWLNVARARLVQGDLSGAWQLIRDKRASGNAGYRFKLACLATAARWGWASP